MTNSEARKRRAEALAVQHEPLDEWFRRIGTALSNEDYETGISVIARLTAERDTALVQVAAVTALADEWLSDVRAKDGPDCRQSMACSVCVKAEQAQRIKRLITDPATDWLSDEEVPR